MGDIIIYGVAAWVGFHALMFVIAVIGTARSNKDTPSCS